LRGCVAGMRQRVAMAIVACTLRASEWAT
jgi:hypothetical protein